MTFSREVYTVQFRNGKSLCIVLLLCVASYTAAAETITQTLGTSFSSLTTLSENSGGFLEFNPALGTLNSVTASLFVNTTFAPSAGSTDSAYNVYFNGYNRGSGQLSYMGSGNVQVTLFAYPTDLSSFYGRDYFLSTLDVSVRNGSLSGTARGTLTYNYTPLASTPEPASILLTLLGASGAYAKLRWKRRADVF